jgi:type IV pilus assembly protein PilY1
LTAASAAVALIAVAGGASAQQTDTNPPLPNVLLLIDNSGSMERMIDGNTPETDPSTSLPATANGTNACNCVDNGTGLITCATWSAANGVAPAPNRWNIVQTAMTGSLQNGFNCVAMPRTPGSIFDEEYHLGQSPYDINYYMPFHRLVAQDTSGGKPGVACVVAPGGVPGVPLGQSMGLGAASGMGGLATAYPSGALIARQYGKLPGVNGGQVLCSSQTQGAMTGFPQYPDGAITEMRDLMRFGLMTFDSDPDPSTGVTGATLINTGAPFQGMWTYFPNWNSGGASSAYGDPVNCGTLSMLAVGARNPGAPPWEGRMVPFQAAATPDITTQEHNNDEVSSVILASRAYGATPAAGMFAGAQYYLWNDPTGPGKTDPYVQGNCRNEYIIFLTDGAPNLDLQPSCSQTPGSGQAAGTCPFPIPYSATGTAATLYANGVSTSSQASIKTYVIGFAVSTVQDNGTPANCSQFAKNGSLAGQCNCNDPNLPAAVAPGTGGGNIGPCCVLQCLAQNGGTTSAYFAQTQGDLQSALGSILADIAKSTTTRTTPAYSPVVTNVLSTTASPSQSNESIYLASFNPSPGLPWSGDLQRQRYVCTYSGSGYTIPPPTITNSQGDDFSANVNSGSGPPRTFIAYQPTTTATGQPASGSVTIRPWATPGVDSVGLNTATMYVGAASAIDTNITPTGMGLLAPCPYTSNVNGAPKQLTTATCATMLLDYTFAQPSFSGEPSDFSFVSRAGNAFGSIYHATPMVVGPPGSLLQDPGYIGFASQWQAPAAPATFHAASGRNTIVYAPTNDGLLHAFWADETKQENNELWAMLLPAAMPNINGGSYPSSHSFLADGAPVVKDLVWDRGSGSVGLGSTSAASDPKAWHTMLVAGYGSSQSGYYAVDVTNPDPTGMQTASTLPADPWPTGPVFRWQLTTMPSTNMPLFGAHSATPAVTTLYMDPHDSGGPREIGVAILPGGEDVVPTTQTSCTRQPKLSDANPPNGSGYVWRPSVRCWGNPTPPNPSGPPAPPQAASDFVLGRSVSIVRIDTGEVLRVFARKQDMALFPSDTINGLKRFTDVQLDSPMTGTPIVYPNDVGTDATKFFIGDADGTVWRFDLSSSEPNNWVGEIYLDLYNQTVDTNPTTTSWNDGQPLQVPPVLSLDPAGEVVLNVASGTTDQFDTTGIEYVYSITEKVNLLGGTAKLRANVNWWMQPAVIDTLPGERVSGPMTVFNGTLYFSTFAAAPVGTQSCSAGTAKLWGRDFVTPADPACAGGGTCNLALGGLPEMQPPPPNLPTAPPPTFIEPDVYDSTLAGKVIPGVSIKATPACANLGTPGPDSYVSGAQHAAPENYSQSGGFSVFSQVGAKGTNGAATKQISMAVTTPVSPTVIDSWAAVLE